MDASSQRVSIAPDPEPWCLVLLGTRLIIVSSSSSSPQERDLKTSESPAQSSCCSNGRNPSCDRIPAAPGLSTCGLADSDSGAPVDVSLAPRPLSLNILLIHFSEREQAVNARRVQDVKDFVSQCDVITVNAPLHEGTKDLINKDLISHFKKGAWLVNTARGAICNAEDVAEAVKSGQLRGYAGDVWNVQPAPKDHPWRYMKNPLGGGNGMTPHCSGTTLDAQIRYAEGTKTSLENFFTGREQDPGNVIVGVGKYESTSYGQC
ncbi:hypothetical protein EVG20_g5961 [Dentipellis fragilis]|uniref:D-isomer specific 2-hydroxyacid dehydrogenase NAD-binding domain-containing protein n=1 Tax=Dentipellis fragilis TaxID=205917 RepID=A0A4Y9YRS8_9AGAM|nr:hypothetical protein EVG20_g5961 [Dentipellis fragilis]